MNELDARLGPISTCYATERLVPLTSTPRSDPLALARHLSCPYRTKDEPADNASPDGRDFP